MAERPVFRRQRLRIAPQNVSLVHAGSQQAACAYAARTVRSGVLSGLRYRDFTVCMTDEAAYRLPMQTLFSRAGIPVYCASSAPVAQNPLIVALLSAMQAVLRYEPGPVLAFLKSEFSPLCEADCDTLEHYAYYWGIRGSAWEKPWQLHPCGLGQPMEPEDEAALQALNALREQAVAPLRTLRLALAKASDGRRAGARHRCTAGNARRCRKASDAARCARTGRAGPARAGMRPALRGAHFRA
ncbi:MAG: hypothetical protein ACLS3C_05380 [Oscillospiraceae bacterium]